MIDKLFKDKDGNTVLGQAPNIPIIVWAVALILSKIPVLDSFQSLLSMIATASLAVWALLEIFSGVNLFRRLLGAIVLSLIVYNFVANF